MHPGRQGSPSPESVQFHMCREQPLVFYGVGERGHGKVPQAGQLTTVETIYCLAVLEARGPGSRCQKGWFFLAALRENVLQASSWIAAVAGNPWCPGLVPVSLRLYLFIASVPFQIMNGTRH